MAGILLGIAIGLFIVFAFGNPFIWLYEKYEHWGYVRRYRK